MYLSIGENYVCDGLGGYCAVKAEKERQYSKAN